MPVRLVLIFCMLAAPLAHAADSVLLDLLPPSATLVVGINVRNMMDSALVRTAMAQAGTVGPQWAAMLQMVGFDPSKDVDEVLLAVTGNGQNPPTLVAARGRFASMRALASRQKGKSQFVFLDDQTVIGGDPAAVQAALRRRGSTASHGNALAVRVAAASERYDLYGLGSIPSMPAGVAGPAAEMARMLDRFQFGMSVKSGVHLAADMDTRSPQAAQGLSMLISTSLQQQAGAKDIAKYLNLTTEGRTVRLSLTIPEAEVQKVMQAGAQAAGAHAALARASMPAIPQLAARPAPAPEKSRVPAGAVLMITGSESDGGTIIVKKP